jgi:hypothetical protein
MDAIKALFEKMQAISEASNGLIDLGYRSTTANLYWQVDDEQRLRFFSLEAIGGGRVRVWSGYFRKQGYDQLASTLENITQPIVPVAPGQQSGVVDILDVDTDRLFALVESLADAVVAAASAMENQNGANDCQYLDAPKEVASSIHSIAPPARFESPSPMQTSQFGLVLSMNHHRGL